jgi:hypothetical protein
MYNRRLIITEDEKSRILNLHENKKKQEFRYFINEQAVTPEQQTQLNQVPDEAIKNYFQSIYTLPNGGFGAYILKQNPSGKLLTGTNGVADGNKVDVKWYLVDPKEANGINQTWIADNGQQFNVVKKGEDFIGDSTSAAEGQTPAQAQPTFKNAPTPLNYGPVAQGTTPGAPISNPNNEVLLQGTDTDYDYKKVGDKYYFKLKENPASPAAKGYKTQGKFKDWTLATNQEAIKKISQLPTLSTAAAFQAPKNADGSDETFDAPVQTVGTTTPSTYPWIENGKASFEALKKSNAADPNFSKFLEQLKNLSQDQIEKIKQDFLAQDFVKNIKTEQPYLVMMQTFEEGKKLTKVKSTTPEASTASTATTPTSQNPEIAADLKTASQIRQEFRQGKRDKNKAIRHYNQMVNKYNRLKSKMSSQDNTAYLQEIGKLKQQIG